MFTGVYKVNRHNKPLWELVKATRCVCPIDTDVAVSPSGNCKQSHWTSTHLLPSGEMRECGVEVCVEEREWCQTQEFPPPPYKATHPTPRDTQDTCMITMKRNIDFTHGKAVRMYNRVELYSSAINHFVDNAL